MGETLSIYQFNERHPSRGGRSALAAPLSLARRAPEAPFRTQLGRNHANSRKMALVDSE